ncbi:MAG: MerR family transcriptional regulator [Deltaproteobacteria bacterium]|nr:MAG: MerR family transcriptional regulator [Deltaproteobacteria bacterium]
MNKDIPEKLYFRIGEVSRLCGVKPYILRYWESQFPEINPNKTRAQHRLYRKKDVELILEIKKLLYDQKFTINGARRRLKKRNDSVREPSSEPSPKEKEYSKAFLSIKKGLEELVELLK